MAWMSHFCRQWRLKPSASKTISSVFHLHNTSAGGESTLDLCYASFEEIPELQHPRRTTGNCRNLQCGDDSILRANVTRDKGSPCLGALGGLDLGVGLAGCRFLSAGKYSALLIEHEWSGPQHPAHGGVTFPGILFMTWRAQGVMNGWLLVFLSRMCCHKASWVVVRLVAFQGVRRKPCMLPPFGGNFWPLNFSFFFTLRLCRWDLRIPVCLLTGYNILNW